MLLAGLLVLATADTVRLGPGVHQGPLVITRPTVLLGAPGAVLRGPGQGSVLVIRAAGTVVRDLTIERSGRNTDRDDAGVMVEADSVLLERLVIRDVFHGIYLREADGTVIRDVAIRGWAGLPESDRGDGVEFYHSHGVLVEDSRISQVRDGFYFAYSDSVVVRRNTVSGVRFGIHYMFSRFNRFEENRFTGNAAGGVIMNSSDLVVRGNLFAWNTAGRSYGLVLQTSTRVMVEDNAVLDNGTGIFVDNAVNGTIRNNLVSGNGLALLLFPNSDGTAFTGNAIVGNTFDAAGGAGASSYQMCLAGRGNFWHRAAARSYDLDGDGILDRPFQAGSPLAELARDREGLRLFLNSPAAAVLDWAERSFPVFTLDQVTDECPLASAPVIAAPDMPGATGGPDRAGILFSAALACGAGVAVFLRWPRRTRPRLNLVRVRPRKLEEA